jgi:hypothetical protein
MGRDRYRHAVVTGEKSVTGLTEAGGGSDDGVKDGLQIGRRARDHAQDLGRGGLLLERLFRLGEQPDVLNGDDGLVGEGLKEGNLRVGEWPALLPGDGDGADRIAISQHGHR